MSEFDIDKFPTSPTGRRMLRRVSPIYDNSYVAKWLYQVMGLEWDEAWQYTKELREQAFTQTVTWGIEYQEHKYSIIPNENLSLQERRARLYRKKTTKFPISPWHIEKYIKDGWNIDADVDETFGWGRLRLKILQDDENKFREMLKDLRRIKPSHLVLSLLYEVIFGGGDDKDDDGGDYIDDIDDETNRVFSADFFAEDSVPYGYVLDLPRCDGSVRYGCIVGVCFDGSRQYDGTLTVGGLSFGDAAKVGRELPYHFRYDGMATAKGEFTCDGAIRYDGFKPYKLEYDDLMDELVTLITLKANNGNTLFEDFVDTQIPADGKANADGSAMFGKSPSPVDENGNIQITKIRCCNGKIRYDGGDINLCDGSLDYGGSFDCTGGGIRYETRRYTDRLDGRLTLAAKQKHLPLVYRYPEFEDSLKNIAEDLTITVTYPHNGEDLPLDLYADGTICYNGIPMTGNHTVLDIGGITQTTTAYMANGTVSYNGFDPRRKPKVGNGATFDGSLTAKGGVLSGIVKDLPQTI